MTAELDSAIQRYKAAIAALTEADHPVASTIVLEALMARNDIQAALESTHQTPGSTLQTISELDQQLRTHAATIAPFTQSADWRASFSPKETAWWWFLEAPKPKKWSQFDWPWAATSVTCLTISLGLVTDISSRFLKGGPDAVAAIAVSTQSVLTLLAAGGALTKAGHEAGKQVLRGVNCPEQYWQEVGAAGSLLILAGLFSFHRSLPAVSHWYTEQGQKAYTSGNWGSAEEHYKRALELDANNDQAHFWLGRLYEDLQKPDEAKTQYQYVGAKMPEAINNLARLNILKKDYTTAVSLLQVPLSSEKSQSLPPEIKFTLLKNLGWARLKQNNYSDAETHLADAIELERSAKLDPAKTVAAYCLKAQVIEAQGNSKNLLPAQKKALPDWTTCLRHSNVTIPEEDEWRTIAQQRLSKLEETP